MREVEDEERKTVRIIEGNGDTDWKGIGAMHVYKEREGIELGAEAGLDIERAGD